MSAQQQIGKFVKPLLKRLGIVGASGTFAGGLTAAGAQRVLHKSVTSAQTGANTDETTLWSYSLPAGTLASDGQAVRIRVYYTTAANTNSKTFYLKANTTVISSFATTTSGLFGYFDATLLRTGAATQFASATLLRSPGTISLSQATLTLTLADANTISLTAQNGTANAGDATFTAAIVEFKP